MGGYFDYWGKAQREIDEAGERPYHPLVCHSLDVAAVGRELLERRPAWTTRLQADGPWTRAELLRVVTFLLGVHDLGKFASGFQGLAPDVERRLRRAVAGFAYKPRHDSGGLTVAFGVPSIRDALAGALFGEGYPAADLDIDFATWISATIGHHGVPPTQDHYVLQQIDPATEAAIVAFIEAWAELVMPEPVSGPPEDEERYDAWLEWLAGRSWLLAGISVGADWVGSADEWFEYAPATVSLADYWRDVARPKAAEAVVGARLVQPAARAACPEGLFSYLDPPTPLQRWATNVPLSGEPACFVLEDLTGSGKTEAALILAHRLIASGAACGLYFALPTMATANAMSARVQTMHRDLFSDASTPTYVLAHSKTALWRHLDRQAKDLGYRGTPSASQAASSWIGGSSKRALLADVGVGTIDQALMGCLAVRHQSLRVAGLAGKVLLVDEVHACDVYMNELLERTLEAHARLGGSAILLSATLPTRTRHSLLAAFDRGRGAPVRETGVAPFPSATQSGHEAVAIEPRRGATREVRVELIRTEEDAEQVLIREARAGRCACWVRNTVVSAIESAARLRATLGEAVTLFHSRFTVADRKRIEDNVLARFGPTSGPARRAGRVVVATQVVEQSLDVDFDVMVTDLAPIDLVVQRAGRVRRHVRDESGARIAGADQRGPIVLHVFAPATDDRPDDRWIQRLQPGTHAVYQLSICEMWLTARWLEREGALRLPQQARAMVEAVYGEGATDEVPEALREHRVVANSAARADQSVALNNTVSFERGYRAGDGFEEDREDRPMTRLGEPTTTLRLALDGHPLHPDPRFGWPLSEVRVARRRVAEPFDRAALAPLEETMRDRGKYAVTVPLMADGEGFSGRARSPEGAPVTILYEPTLGLRVEREEASE